MSLSAVLLLVTCFTFIGETWGCNYKFMKDGAICDRETFCTYGCHKSNHRCWSECNGICCVHADCFGENVNCAGGKCSLPEWCYLEGSNYDGKVKCRMNTDCAKENKTNFPTKYKCTGLCSV